MKEEITITGNLLIEALDLKTGRVSRQQIKNLVVTTGLNLIRDRLKGTGNAISHLAVGTSSTAASAGQTSLGVEVFRDVITQTDTATAAQLVVKYYLASGSANGNTLREAGIFNAASSGDMLSRAVLNNAIVKTSSISATFTWTITLSAT